MFCYDYPRRKSAPKIEAGSDASEVAWFSTDLFDEACESKPAVKRPTLAFDHQKII